MYKCTYVAGDRQIQVYGIMMKGEKIVGTTADAAAVL